MVQEFLRSPYMLRQWQELSYVAGMLPTALSRARVWGFLENSPGQ